MANNSSRFRQLNTLAVTSLILLGPFAFYYLFYFSDQKNYFINRDFRLLSVLSKQIEMKVDNIGRAYRRAADTAVNTPASTAADVEHQGRAKIPKGLDKERIDDFLRPITDQGTAIKAATDAENPEQSTLPKVGNGKSVVSLNVKHEDGASWLYFDYLNPNPKNPVPVAARTKNPALAIHARSTLQNLIGPFVKNFVNPREFDDVIITQESGAVIFQQGPAALNITNLDSLININKDQKNNDSGLARQNSSVLDVRLADTDYKLFIQPIQLSLPGTNSNSDQGVRWYVCGLVRRSHFLSESAAISYTILIVLTFLFLFVALSTPFLKLLFMGCRERVRVRDVYFLFLCTLMGSALLTVLLLYGISYLDSGIEMDAQLERLSNEIVKNFDEELRQANKQLRKLTDEVLTKELTEIKSQEPAVKPRADQTGPKAEDKSGAYALLSQLQIGKKTESVSGKQNQAEANNYGCVPPKRCLGENNILGRLIGYDDDYPYLGSVTWIDPDGKQRIKWTTRSSLASFFPVDERAYFKNIVAERTWECCKPTEQAPAQKYYLEPIYSKGTGGLQVILSTPIPDPDRKLGTWVAALDFRALSLYQTVLPPNLGFGYCVINNEGNVLFHSDESRNLSEDFFVETDNDDYLRSVVLAREQKLLGVQYQGAGHRLFVRPIPDTPWTLVTFQEKKLLRTVWLEVIAASMYLFIIYAMVLLVFLRFYYLRHWENRAALVWPDRDLAPNYILSIISNLLLALAFGLSIPIFNEWVVVVLAFVLPAVGFSFHLLNLRGRLRLGRYSEAIGTLARRYAPGSYRRGYLLSLVTLFLLTSVLPMFAFFKFAHDREMRLYVGLGQINLARSLEERAVQVREQYAKLGSPAGSNIAAEDSVAKKKAFLKKRLRVDHRESIEQNRCWDVYSQFFFNTNFEICDNKSTDPRCGDFAPVENRFQSVLAAILPFNNTISFRIRGLMSSMSGDEESVWQRQNADSNGILKLSERVKIDGDDDYKVLLVSSVAPLLGKDQSGFWWAGFFGILLLVPLLLYGLIGFIGRRIFLLDTDAPATLYGEELHEEDVSQNAFVLASSFIRRDRLLASKGFDVIDLRTLKKKSWDGFLKGQKQSDKIALNYFEYNHEDPKANREKVQFLEALLIHNRKVVVLSSVDPTDYRFEMNGGETNGNGVAVNGSGARLLSSFFRVYVEDSGTLQSFLDKLSEQKKTWFEKASSRREKKRLERLFEVLQSECKARAFLQTIGEVLLTKKELGTLNSEDIIQHVQEKANAYYHAIWETCSRDEKLTLCNVAKCHLVSSKNPDLPRLLKRGLVSKESRLRPMNESFSRFVEVEGSPEKLVAWQRESEGSSSWDMLRVPFFIILVGAAAFLFVSQRELYNSTLAFVSAFAAGMPTILKFLGFFQSGRAGGVAGH